MTNPTKVLLVDDYPENLSALHALLKNDEIELVDASSGPEALEALLVHEVALGVIDVQMPEMDGFELAQVMRSTERTRQIPIVFVTAASHEQQRIFEGYSVGAVDFLSKPIEPEILRSKVEVFVQLHRQKQQLAEQIEVQNEMLRVNELLTAAIGHDLRNPLNLVLAAAEIVRSRSEDEQIRWAAEMIRSGGKRMTRIIEQLLDFSKIRVNGKLVLSPAFFDLGELTGRIVTEHQLADASASISLETSGDLRVFWDETRIGRLLSNLIGNALTHGDRSQPIRIHVEGTNDRHIRLSIHNQGHIPPLVQPVIFSPFKNVSGGRRSGASGLGLGLYIVDQIVKLHSGTIEVESCEIRGTRFTLHIPRLPEGTAQYAAVH